MNGDDKYGTFFTSKSRNQNQQSSEENVTIDDPYNLKGNISQKLNPTIKVYKD